MNYVLSGISQDIQKVEKGTALLFQDIAFLPTEAITSEDTLEIHVTFTTEECLSIERSGLKLQIICKEPAHYFRALTRALHHLAESTYRYSETIYFPKNGVMLDCSRNSVFTTEKVKAMIRILARLGMNELLLYTEDTYEVPEEPYFGIYRGRYSQNEIREIDAYAQIFGVELIPCIQTLAHLRNALKWPIDPDLIDTYDNLMVGEEKVYTYIEHLLQAVKSSFSTRRVHLGMDEAVSLGTGQYLEKNGYSPKSDLMKEHTSRVFQICKKLELEPMMWSDMYITSNNGSSYYDVDEHTDTSNWKKPDKELGLVYWDYYNNDVDLYRNMLRVHEELSDKIIYAGGSWIWNGISPNYSRTFQCMMAALKACREYHVKEIFCTAWMDNGAETPVDAVLPGFALFAHLGFHSEADAKTLAEEFFYATGGQLDDFYQLDAFDSLFTGAGKNITSDNPSKFFLYQDALLGMFDFHARNMETETYYANLAQKLESCKKTSSAYKDLFTFYQLLAQILTQKADLGLRIKAAYDEGDLSTLDQICEQVIPHLTDLLWEMKLLREQLWLRDAKPFGYELLDVKLGGVITRLESNRRRIRSYLDGHVSALIELEQPRLPFFPGENPVGHGKEMRLGENRWHRIISGCDLIDTI